MPTEKPAAHTPGPWRIRQNLDISTHEEDFESEVVVANVVTGMQFGVAERKENARLIAAAPDLLECVKEALKVNIPLRFGLRQQFEAAIAKATTTQP